MKNRKPSVAPSVASVAPSDAKITCKKNNPINNGYKINLLDSQIPDAKFNEILANSIELLKDSKACKADVL